MTCFEKFPKNKKDRDRRQRTDDFSSVLPDSHGHPVFHRFTSLHWLSPDYFRWHFSHSQNTFFRDMKRLRLFVLLFYHIRPRFTTKPTGSKPLQNRYKRYRFEIVKVGFTVPFGLWMVGERLGLSKARSNFDVMYKRLNFTKFLRVPVRADL